MAWDYYNIWYAAPILWFILSFWKLPYYGEKADALINRFCVSADVDKDSA